MLKVIAAHFVEEFLKLQDKTHHVKNFETMRNCFNLHEILAEGLSAKLIYVLIGFLIRAHSFQVNQVRIYGIVF